MTWEKGAFRDCRGCVLFCGVVMGDNGRPRRARGTLPLVVGPGRQRSVCRFPQQPPPVHHQSGAGRASPKMAQTLARHSDVRLTLEVYTHVTCTTRPPPLPRCRPHRPAGQQAPDRGRGASGYGDGGRVRRASFGALCGALGCPNRCPTPRTGEVAGRTRLHRRPPGGQENGDQKIAATPDSTGRYRTTPRHQSASPCTDGRAARPKYPRQGSNL